MMRYLTICFFFLLSLVWPHTSHAQPAGTVNLCLFVVPAIVVRIVDGDTFTVKAQVWSRQTWEGSVRLNGINAPETHSQCQEEKDAAVLAIKALQELLPLGKAVLLCNPSEDVYPGRVDAHVLTSSGRTVSDLLLALGVVRPYDGKKKRPSWCKEAVPAH